MIQSGRCCIGSALSDSTSVTRVPGFRQLIWENGVVNSRRAMPFLRRFRGAFCTVLVLLSISASSASASATLLLEEPYGKLGFFTATGHAAVYLSGVCAETPLVLRTCAAGELGAVISRYDGVAGYDWVAI